MKIKTFFTVAISLLFLASAWPEARAANEPDLLKGVEIEAKKGGYRLIDVDSLWLLYQDKQQNLLLVDTRQEWEYHAGYIQGAVLFSMEPTWLARMTQRGALEQFLGKDKSKTIVFY